MFANRIFQKRVNKQHAGREKKSEKIEKMQGAKGSQIEAFFERGVQTDQQK